MDHETLENRRVGKQSYPTSIFDDPVSHAQTVILPPEIGY